MIKLLLFLILVLGLAYGFSVLADLPGDVVITVAGQEISFTLMVAAVALVATIVTVMLVWWLIKVIFTSPQRVTRFFRLRRRDRGYQALSTGIVAAGAGDPVTARKMLKRADGLLPSSSEPLIQLLDAQTVMLEGDQEKARASFEKMLEDPELRDLGLRGLYMEAQRLGDRNAQKHYAEKAAELAPQLGWAGKAALDLKTSAGDWEGALRLVDQQKAAKNMDKDTAKRKRAVLLTAVAMENVEPDPSRAKQAGLEAHRLAPTFAPAAVAAADACLRLNEMRRAAKVLETTWRKEPHPDVALSYVNVRAGDSALDRLKKARKLEQLKPNNTESSLIVAQMAMEAGEFEDARKAVASILRNEPRESAYMLMAEIEERETGDQGKIREWLSRALRAPRDPSWTADGYIAEKWAPFSPISGRIDAFQWKVPVERIGGNLLEEDLDPMQRGVAPAAMIEPQPLEDASNNEVEPTPVAEPDDKGADEALKTTAAAGAAAAATSTIAADEAAVDAATEPKPSDVETQDAVDVIVEAVAEPSGEGVDAIGESDSSKSAETVEVPAANDDEIQPEPPVEEHAPSEIKEAGSETPPVNGIDEKSDDAVVPPIPDDPGVRPGAEPADKSRRFRLF
ncbi:MAG: heme biosynthesis HemY N-terminal domain-containing protein [Pseudomonadota bacterium]